jgi:hypothetical protein
MAVVGMAELRAAAREIDWKNIVWESVRAATEDQLKQKYPLRK